MQKNGHNINNNRKYVCFLGIQSVRLFDKNISTICFLFRWIGVICWRSLTICMPPNKCIHLYMYYGQRNRHSPNLFCVHSLCYCCYCCCSFFVSQYDILICWCDSDIVVVHLKAAIHSFYFIIFALFVFSHSVIIRMRFNYTHFRPFPMYNDASHKTELFIILFYFALNISSMPYFWHIFPSHCMRFVFNALFFFCVISTGYTDDRNEKKTNWQNFRR